MGALPGHPSSSEATTQGQRRGPTHETGWRLMLRRARRGRRKGATPCDRRGRPGPHGRARHAKHARALGGAQARASLQVAANARPSPG
eukprot:9161635-Alexandrium_andersonii.AAC.1